MGSKKSDGSPDAVPRTFDEACYQTAKELAELVCRKQRDYGKDNILDFGEFGILVRSNDKIARLKNLHKTGREAVNEPKQDAWRDLGGYALLAMILYRGWFTLPLEE